MVLLVNILLLIAVILFRLIQYFELEIRVEAVMTTCIERPEPRKAKLCVWTDLNVYNTDRIAKCTTASETKTLLQEIFGLSDSPRNDVLVDLYMHAIAFSKLQNFTKEQTSTYFSILKQTHEVCVATPFGNVDDCFSFFRELVLTHAVHRPPWSLEIFSPQQVETITTHVINTYFRHFKLYKYTFTPKVKLDISLQYEGLPPTPEPEPEPELAVEEEGTITTLEQSDALAAVETPDQMRETPTVDVEEEKPEEDEVANELESVVRKAVSAQLKQMQAVVDKQLDDTDKVINEKIQILETGSPRTPKEGKGGKRTPKSSAKGKKK